MRFEKRNIFLIVFLTVALSLAFIYACNNKESNNITITKCYSVEERTVRGTSLDPIIKDGDIIDVLLNYYDCNQIEREDIVVFQYSENKEPVIKIVKGMPNDKFELKETDFGYNIIINDQVVENSEGNPYLLTGNKYKMLSLYQRDYKGVIPQNSYLILGNLVSGSFDSTQFGLIDGSDILGKVKK